MTRLFLDLARHLARALLEIPFAFFDVGAHTVALVESDPVPLAGFTA